MIEKATSATNDGNPTFIISFIISISIFALPKDNLPFYPRSEVSVLTL